MEFYRDIFILRIFRNEMQFEMYGQVQGAAGSCLTAAPTKRGRGCTTSAPVVMKILFFYVLKAQCIPDSSRRIPSLKTYHELPALFVPPSKPSLAVVKHVSSSFPKLQKKFRNERKTTPEGLNPAPLPRPGSLVFFHTLSKSGSWPARTNTTKNSA